MREGREGGKGGREGGREGGRREEGGKKGGREGGEGEEGKDDTVKLELNSSPPTSAVADAPVGPSVPVLAEAAPFTVNPSFFLNRWRKLFSPFAAGNNNNNSKYFFPLLLSSPLLSPASFSPPRPSCLPT